MVMSGKEQLFLAYPFWLVLSLNSRATLFVWHLDLLDLLICSWRALLYSLQESLKLKPHSMMGKEILVTTP